MQFSPRNASHFLGQATLGATLEQIENLSGSTPEVWLDRQINLPAPSYLKRTQEIWEYFKGKFIERHGWDKLAADVFNPCVPYWYYWRMAWWDHVMTEEDHLRQRVAQALSQTFVVSEKSQLELSSFGLASFYDVLSRNAFGNFRDLLIEVSLHPAMGVYLSHLFNRKGDPSKNLRPDENYAREIMQLFTIGLYELNQDGTRKKDGNGQDIPTYDNADIQEMAKVFTGLELAGYYWPWDKSYASYPVDWAPDYELNQSIVMANLWTPMRMNEAYHETGEKRILKRATLPAGQDGMTDIAQAIDILFNHPNTGPFIGHQLIQRLVKSNPSPAYIARVSAAFADNGKGVRGDMGAVTKAILLDPEARERTAETQRIREPLIRYTQFMRAFKAQNYSGRMWNYGYQFEERVKQSILSAPSVFNFYTPDFAPNGPIYDAGMAAPEFQLHDTSSSVGYVNLAVEWFFGGEFMEVFTEVDPIAITHPHFEGDIKEEDRVYLDLSWEYAYAEDPAGLVDHLNTLLAGGGLSQDTVAAMVSAIEPLRGDPDNMVPYALLLVFLAPDYVAMS